MLDPLADVSRETRGQLEQYVALLLRWNARINLIGRATETDVWRRHIADSAQLCGCAGRWQGWADLGSGGGLPGVVVAILSGGCVTCIESDGRKCAFLRTAARELGVAVEVVQARIESAPPARADVVSARALAPLPGLLDLAARHLAAGGKCMFLKGKSWREELEAARRSWHFSCDAIPSVTDDAAVVLRIGDLARA